MNFIDFKNLTLQWWKKGKIIEIIFVYLVVAQTYQPEIMTEYVIRGNSAILKCSIPSYIAEFVTIEAWIREDGEIYLPEHQQSANAGHQGISNRKKLYLQ